MGLYKNVPKERKKEECIFMGDERICNALQVDACDPAGCAFFKTVKMQEESLDNIRTGKWKPVSRGNR